MNPTPADYHKAFMLLLPNWNPIERIAKALANERLAGFTSGAEIGYRAGLDIASNLDTHQTKETP